MLPPAPAAGSDQLIVVGASAGGVEALSRFVGTLPADLLAPVVIAQHLDPTRPSHLAEILARQTSLPVRSVEAHEALRPGTVFVVPANRHVAITDHHVEVHADPTRRPTPSVDLLLATAATTFGERLIAVILTGSGSDGAVGAHAVKEAGGTVIIQDPETAAFPSMPRALAPSLVDLSLPIEEIGPVLRDLIGPLASAQAASDPDLERLLTRLHERHGIDFSAYKPATILRRLWRRVAAAKVATIGEYLEYLEAHPEEEQRLIADFLIKVTRFLRDPAVFTRLREEIIPELVATAQRERRELRLWSAGCATGEEAYSLALLVAEALASTPAPPPVRIFATDLDATALAFARRGVYPASAVADVPAELRDRYLTPRDGAVEVTKPVRSLIIFGSHDLAQRPPFPHVDLVVCRNVLIYFTPELQRRALELFAFSLREGGVLVLGTGETTGPVTQAFAPLDRRLRLYRRQGVPIALPLARLPTPAEAQSAIGPPTPSRRSPREQALQRATTETADARFQGERAEELVRRLPVGVAVVNRSYDLEVINGAARELLGIHGLALGQDLIHQAQRVPSTALRAAIDAVLGGEVPAAMEAVLTSETATGETRHLTLSCHPGRASPDGLVDTVLVLITDVTAPVAAGQALVAAAAEQAAVAAAAEEAAVAAATEQAAEAATLRQTVERMASANRQLLRANRELADNLDRVREQEDELRQAAVAAQVAAEEIETLNEELQASNEELETLHEEAQATVEELSVANDELQARAGELEELAAAHAAEQVRLSAVLASMADAVLVVDATSRVVRTNAAYDALVDTLAAPFIPADAQGMPLPALATPERRVARGETFQLDFTVAAEDGTQRWFEANGRPLVDQAGGVLVIRDITDRTLRRLQEEFLTWAGHELRTPLTTLQGYLQLATRRLDANADERLRRFLTLAHELAQRQGTLIAELVDATRLHSGRLALDLAPLDLVPLVTHAVELAQVLAEGQVLVVEAGEEPLSVAGDAGRLEQVVLNLLTNAIRHAVGTERIEVRLRRDGDAAELVVRDSGPGIPVEALETIFARFAQVEPTKRPGAAGLGLGLYIAREIVEAHGGTITAHSAPGDGATFTIRLPLLAEVSRTSS